MFCEYTASSGYVEKMCNQTPNQNEICDKIVFTFRKLKIPPEDLHCYIHLSFGNNIFLKLISRWLSDTKTPLQGLSVWE